MNIYFYLDLQIFIWHVGELPCISSSAVKSIYHDLSLSIYMIMFIAYIISFLIQYCNKIIVKMFNNTIIEYYLYLYENAHINTYK